MAKTRKPNPLKSEGHMAHNGGWSNKWPELRHGTKTHAGYMSHLLKGNGVAGGRTAHIDATPRQDKKALNLVKAGKHWKEAQGRVIRACARSWWESVGQDLDAQYHGEA